MLKQTKSIVIIITILVSSIGCMQLRYRLDHPQVKKTKPQALPVLSDDDTEVYYKFEVLKLEAFMRKELLDEETLPKFYLQAVDKMQRIEIKDIATLQEFNRLHNSVSGYHAQKLAQGMKSRQKTPMKYRRLLTDLKRHEDKVMELQNRCFTLLQQKQQHQVAFLFATDAP